MNFERQPFRKYKEGESRDTFTVALNAEERTMLEAIKDALHEDKDSTALKQAGLYIATIVLHDDKIKRVSDLAVANYRRGYRTGRLRKIDI